MPDDNLFTDIERTLRDGLASITLGGSPVPIRVVTPDPDFVELETPCVTMQLVDFRRDTPRTVNDREVEKDLDEMTAKIKKRSEAYNFHYSLTGHASKNRDDRLLLGEIALFVDENPVMTSILFGTVFYLHRDITFRELSKARDFAKSVGVIVKTRLPMRHEEIVPLVQERLVTADVI